LHFVKRHKFCCSSYIIRVIKSRRTRWTWHVARMGEINAYKFFVAKPEKKGALGRTRHRWQDNIRKDLREIGWEVVDWIHLI